MDRRTLLNSSRAKFVSAFNETIGGVVHRSIEGLYYKAEKSSSSQAQRQILDARTMLTRHEKVLLQHIMNQLDTLLQRSYQTAYDTFRPSFFKATKGKPLALMDLNTFEDDLRIDVITSRFRSEAEEQLRDLNIRIAILFERNDIAERENPFRSYLLTRSIVLGVEELHFDNEMMVILTDQISEELVNKVVSLYEVVNQHLSECGVAAQLQFKPQRMPSDLTNPIGYDPTPESAASPVPQAHQTAPAPATQRPAANSMPMPPAQNGVPPMFKVGKIEHLINLVKNRNTQNARAATQGNGNAWMLAGEQEGQLRAAVGMPGAGFVGGGGGVGGPGFLGGGAAGVSGGAAGGSDGAGSGLGETVGGLLNQASATVSGWLGGAQEMGDTLRRVFFGGGTRAAFGDHGADSSGSGSMEGGGHGGGSGGGSGGSGGGFGGDAVGVGGIGGAGGNAGGTVGESGGRFSGGGDYVAISPQLHSALRVAIPSSADMFGVDGEVRNLIIERRDNLNAITNDQHEKMTIDIVAMLFEFILKDHQVPAEVRAQLGRLQFSVLKMALMDSALLTTKSHPARMLVNRIGSISIGLQQIDPSGERISAEICRIVEELLASDSENPQLFSKMLDELDSFIAKELLASNNKVEQAVQVVVNAEERSKKLNQESAKLANVLEGILITPYLKRFLLETWAHVIERVERNATADSTRFRLLVPNLLWSILPKSNKEDRSMLLQIIPIIVPVLREGMSSVAWLPEHQQEFLNWLVDAHTTVMRAPLSDESVLTLVEIQRHFHSFVYPDAEPDADVDSDAKVDINRSFLDEAIKELEHELNHVGVIQHLDSSPDVTGESESDVIADESDSELSDDGVELAESSNDAHISGDGESKSGGEDILDRLRSGVIVEINLSGIPTKGRLNWISPNSTNLILTVNGQESPSIISVRMFRRMLKNSRARFVEVAPLFERAVQSLLESADLVDLAHAA